MSNKALSILFGSIDKETRHYIMRRIEHPYKKFGTPKQKKQDNV